MDKFADHIKPFLFLWGGVVLANQVLFFNACLAPYCLIAAAPHTFILSLVLYFFYLKTQHNETKNETAQETKVDVRLQSLKKKQAVSPRESIKRAKTSSFEETTSSATSGTQDDVLKQRGDGYELHIGRRFELQGELVIYNGLINGYDDDGVDVIVVSKSKRSVHLIQCKHWKQLEFTQSHLNKIYQKLDNYTFNNNDFSSEYINRFLSIKRDEPDIVHAIRESRAYSVIRKTLYLSSNKVVQRDVWPLLEHIKDNIYRFKDIKVVFHSL